MATETTGKHGTGIYFKVRCKSKEQRTRLNTMASDLCKTLELENAEMLEHLLAAALPKTTK